LQDSLPVKTIHPHFSISSDVLRQSDKDLEMFLESRETALKNLGEIAPLFINEEMQEQIQIIQEKQE